MEPEQRRLFEAYTYARTDRLIGILNDEIPMTRRDWRELWTVYREGIYSVGTEPFMSEFINWVVIMQCEVTW
jgi:hypothetical protein